MAYRSPLIDTPADFIAPTEYYVEVVLPDSYPHGGPYPVLFIGPVGPMPDTTGNGILLAKAMDIHNTYDCILVTATFKTYPWYGSRTDGTFAHDQHIIESIFPLVEETYNGIADREGRLMIGFSKSGWGALSLILRNPDAFGYAAAWDSPWNMTYGQYLSGVSFDTSAQFDAYNPKTILPAHVASVNDKERVWISAGRSFKAHHAGMISLLQANSVPYRDRYLDAPEHKWDADWFGAGCQALFSMRAA